MSLTLFIIDREFYKFFINNTTPSWVQNQILLNFHRLYIDIHDENDPGWPEIVHIFFSLLQTERIQQAIEFFIFYFEDSSDQNLAQLIFPLINFEHPDIGTRVSWLCLSCVFSIVFPDFPIIIENCPKFFYSITNQELIVKSTKYYFRLFSLHSNQMDNSVRGIASFLIKVLSHTEYEEGVRVLAVHYLCEIIKIKKSISDIFERNSDQIYPIFLMQLINPHACSELYFEIIRFFDKAVKVDAIDIDVVKNLASQLNTYVQSIFLPCTLR